MPVDRRDLRRRLFILAADQVGYFTAAQAKELGYSYQAQAHHVGVGNWLRVGRGIFRLAEWVPSIHDHLASWTLWSRGRAVVSHESALSVHGIGEFESARIHLTVPCGFSMRDPALVLHNADLPGGDMVERTGFKLTTVIRSLVDIAALSPDEDQLARAIEEAREGGLLTIRQLRAQSEAIDTKAALYIERAIQLRGSLGQLPSQVGNVIGYPVADRQQELEGLTAELDRRIERRLIPLEEGKRASEEMLPVIAEQLAALDCRVDAVETRPPE